MRKEWSTIPFKTVQHRPRQTIAMVESPLKLGMRSMRSNFEIDPEAAPEISNCAHVEANLDLISCKHTKCSP